MARPYIVTVADFGVQETYMKTVRQRRFRRLDAARRYETKFYKKAMRRPGATGTIERWGSVANNAKVKDSDSLMTRYITITYRP